MSFRLVPKSVTLYMTLNDLEGLNGVVAVIFVISTKSAAFGRTA